MMVNEGNVCLGCPDALQTEDKVRLMGGVFTLWLSSDSDNTAQKIKISVDTFCTILSKYMKKQ
jgi:hypothetical protein